MAMSAVAMTSAVTVSADITLAARVMSGAMADLARTAGPRGLLEEQHLREGKTAARCQAAAAKQSQSNRSTANQMKQKQMANTGNIKDID
jgi:hypothetical protein